MAKERLTNQKQAILHYLQSTVEHPSAETVYVKVKKTLPQISKGTVYRILDNFADNGDILRIDAGINRYDADMTQHNHFICDKCEKIYDIFLKKNNNIRKNIPKIGQVRKKMVLYYGICNKCK